MCAARLEPTGAYEWSNAEHAGVSRPYDVVRQPNRCKFAAMGLGAGAGNVVLNGKRACACSSLIKDLAVGDAVTLTWKTVGWKGVLDEIGGQPLLVQNGHNVGPTSDAGPSYFYGNNPRTGVGVNEGCTDADTATL